jgi:hypothetical protein
MGGRADAQHPPGAAAEHGAPRSQRLRLGQDVARACRHLLAFRGEDDPATNPVEQSHAELPFQIADLAR